MTDTSRPRRRLTLIGSAAAALALSASLAPGVAVAGPPDSSPGASRAAAATASQRTVDVMTRNLYLGADLEPVILALTAEPDPSNPLLVPNAAAATWKAVIATKPEERMAAIAEEIAAEMPAVVGLQEVTRWTTFDYNPATGASSNPVVVYDFLQLLLDALEQRGVAYEEVAGATAHNFTSPPIPYTTQNTPPYVTKSVQLADRDVILRRADISTRNAHQGNFENIVRFPIPDGAGGTTLLPVDRGWGSVDVHSKSMKFRFVNAHLEAFAVPDPSNPTADAAEGIRNLQVGELLAAQEEISDRHGDLPIVYVGDYNSKAPTAPAYQRLVAGVGYDAWILDNPNAPTDAGLTCCFDADLADPTDPLTSRIDLVVVDEHVDVLDVDVIGEDPETDFMTPPGLWPSDHAGVVAALRIDHPREWRPESRH